MERERPSVSDDRQRDGSDNEDAPGQRLLVVHFAERGQDRRCIVTLGSGALPVPATPKAKVNYRCCRVQDQFAVSSDSQKAVLSMANSGLGIWVAMQGSAVVRLFHALTHECICDVNLAPAVKKMLSGSRSYLKFNHFNN